MHFQPLKSKFWVKNCVPKRIVFVNWDIQLCRLTQMKTFVFHNVFIGNISIVPTQACRQLAINHHYGWLVRLAIDLAVLCVMWNRKWPRKYYQLMPWPVDCFHFTQRINPPLPGHRQHIGMTIWYCMIQPAKICFEQLKWWVTHYSYPFNSCSWCIDRL